MPTKKKAATARKSAKKTGRTAGARKPAGRKAAVRKGAVRKGAVRKVAKVVEAKARQGLGVAKVGLERLTTATSHLVEEVKEKLGG